MNTHLTGKNNMHNYSYIIKFLILLLLSTFFTAVVQAEVMPKKNTEFLYALNASQANGFMLPSDVATSGQYAYVVDAGHHRILAFNLQGEFQFSFGQRGSGNSELDYPVGIDVATNGDVYVADSGNKRVQVFSETGKYLRQFKVKSGRYRLRPVDVLVNEKQNELYVTSSDNHKVLVFTVKGKLKRSWGGNGINEGDFRYPATMAHLKDGRIAVVDVLNSRVQVFEKNGDYSIQISEWGVTQGQVFRPKGVAIDNDGNFYISDSFLNLVQVFSDTGKLLHMLEMPESHELYTPVGMTFDKYNHLYITEMRNNRVSIFNVKP